jgi:hypothetical protein
MAVHLTAIAGWAGLIQRMVLPAIWVCSCWTAQVHRPADFQYADGDEQSATGNHEGAVVAFDAFDHGESRLWMPNWSSTSCDLGIFVNQSTEPIATSDAKLGGRREGRERVEWCCLVQCPVRPMVVEVRDVLG